MVFSKLGWRRPLGAEAVFCRWGSGDRCVDLWLWIPLALLPPVVAHTDRQEEEAGQELGGETQ